MKRAPARRLGASLPELEPTAPVAPTLVAPTRLATTSTVTSLSGPLTMPSLTDAQAAEARAELGTDVDLVDLKSRYDRLEDFDAAITEMLRERLATLKASPAIFAVDGYSQNVSSNIAALEAKLEERTGVDGPGGMSVVRIVPPPPMRRR